MKTLLALLLAASLVANAVFVVVRVSRNSSTAPAATNVAAGASETAPDAAAKKSAVGSAADADATLVAKAWTKVQAGDIHTLAERLRAAGFPPSMIKAIVSAQVYEQFAARRKALLAEQEDVPFWKSQQRYVIDPKAMAELRAINREQTELMQSLLGADGYLGSEETSAYQKKMFGDLSRDKLDQMQNITSDYNELRQQIYQAANGVILPEDREKLALLEKEQRADLAKLLTPDELENYDLRSSNTANMLRSALGTFKPSEDEFRTIFRATRDAEDRFGSLSQGNPDQVRQIQAAALDALKSTLPPDRFADLKQATDPQYQQINRLVARLELPNSASLEVVAVQQDIQKRVGAIRGNRELSGDQRNEQLSALAQEATAKVSTALGGTRGLEAYKNYGGQWLQNIAPRPPANPLSGVPSATPTH